MNVLLAAATALGCLVAAAWVGTRAYQGRHRWDQVAPALIMIELTLLVQAGLIGSGLLHGHRPAEPSAHIAYLATGLVVLPATATQVADDDRRWAAAFIALALLVVAVIVIRTAVTW